MPLSRAPAEESFQARNKRENTVTGWMISKLTYALNGELASVPPHLGNLRQRRSTVEAAVAVTATPLPEADAPELGSDRLTAIISGAWATSMLPGDLFSISYQSFRRLQESNSGGCPLQLQLGAMNPMRSVWWLGYLGQRWISAHLLGGRKGHELWFLPIPGNEGQRKTRPCLSVFHPSLKDRSVTNPSTYLDCVKKVVSMRGHLSPQGFSCP